MVVLYFLIALIATILGAMAGLGGGVIIKPALDTLNHFPLESIGLMSSITILSMAVVSMYYQFKKGFGINVFLILIAIGSIIGGIIGTKLFAVFVDIIGNDSLAKGIQSVMLAVLLIFIFAAKIFNVRSFCIKNHIAIFMAGFILGTVSSFLGIGGGPINVAVLYILFSMDTKQAAVGSIFIILLAQTAKVITVTVTTGFGGYDLSMLPYLMAGGVVGGLTGSKFNKMFSESVIKVVFLAAVGGIILLNIYNSISFLGSF